MVRLDGDACLVEQDRVVLRRCGPLPRLRSLSGLWRRVRLSSSATTERVRNPESLGVITGYHASVGPAKVGCPVLAVARLKCPGNRHQPSRRLVAERREILECPRTTGDDCCPLKVAATSPEHLERLVDEPAGPGSTTTSVVRGRTLPCHGPDRPPDRRATRTRRPSRVRGRPGSGQPPSRSRRSSACSSSSARMLSIRRRVVGSLSPSQRMISW